MLPFPNEMVIHLNMLDACMKHWITSKRQDTKVITSKSRRVRKSDTKAFEQHSKPI